MFGGQAPVFGSGKPFASASGFAAKGTSSAFGGFGGAASVFAPATGFGEAATGNQSTVGGFAVGTGFGASTTSTFGGANAPNPFGAPATSAFGGPATFTSRPGAATGFGKPPFQESGFGNTAGSFGGKPRLNPNAPAFQPSQKAPPTIQPSNQIYVKLSSTSTLTEVQIREHFAKYGLVLEVSVLPGKAFITMGSIPEAQAAINAPKHPEMLIVSFNAHPRLATTVANHSLPTSEMESEDIEPHNTEATDAEEKRRQRRIELKKMELKKRLEQQKAALQTAVTTQVAQPEQTTMRDQSMARQDGFVVGTCTLMCPLVETQNRLQGNQIDLLEQPHPELPHLGSDVEKLTITKFQRSAANLDMDKPELIRTPEALDMTAQYLWRNIVDIDQGPDPRFRDSTLPGDRPSLVYINNFLMDRLKRINSEVNLQGFTKPGGPSSAIVTTVLEECVRCQILLYQEMMDMPESEREGYSERLANESLNSTLKSLLETYPKLPTGCRSNEPEMQAYYMLLQLAAKEQSAYSIVQETYLRYRNFPIVLLAKCGYDAFFSGDFARFFHLIKSPETPFLIACLLRRRMDTGRQIAWAHLNGLFKENTKIPLVTVARMLCLDSVEDARSLCNTAGASTDSDSCMIGGLNSLPEDARFPCNALQHMKRGIERKYLVCDVSRTWFKKGEPRLQALRGQSLVAQSQARDSGHVANITEPIRVFEDEQLRKQRELAAAREQAELMEKRKREEEARLKQLEEAKRREEEEKRRLELERAKQEEERRKKEEREQQERELQRIKAEKERQEELERQKMRQRQQALKDGIAWLDSFFKKRSKSLAFHSWYLRARKETELLEKRKQAISSIVNINNRIHLRFTLKEWRRRARLLKAVSLLQSALRSILLRRAWCAIDNVLGVTLKSRQERFQQSLLGLLDIFLAKDDDEESTEKGAKIRKSSFSASQDGFFRAIEAVIPLESMESYPSSHRVAIVSASRPALIRCLFAALKAVGVVPVLVSPGDDLRTVMGALGVVSILSDDTSEQEYTTVDKALAIADSSLSSGSPRIPMLQAIIGNSLIYREWGERGVESVHLDMKGKPQILAQSLLNACSRFVMSASSCRRVEIHLVSMSRLVFSRLPRLKWSHFASTRDWLQAINIEIRRLCDTIVSSARGVFWPPIEDGLENTNHNAIINDASFLNDSANDVQPIQTVSLNIDWNSSKSLERIEKMLLQCILPSEYDNESIEAFAAFCGVSSTWLKGTLEYAVGDGLWVWEQVVIAILRNRIDPEMKVHVILECLPPSLGKKSLSKAKRENPWTGYSVAKPEPTSSTDLYISRLPDTRDYKRSRISDEDYERELKRHVDSGLQTRPLIEYPTSRKEKEHDLVSRAKHERQLQDQFTKKLGNVLRMGSNFTVGN